MARSNAVGRWHNSSGPFTHPILLNMPEFCCRCQVYVIVEELIPESHRSGNIDLAMVSLLLGFVKIMVLDVALA
jgi:ZIP family zinc transporter